MWLLMIDFVINDVFSSAYVILCQMIGLLERLRKTMKYLRQGSRSSGRDFNQVLANTKLEC
jgi:hypothetical protein